MQWNKAYVIQWKQCLHRNLLLKKSVKAQLPQVNSLTSGVAQSRAFTK